MHASFFFPSNTRLQQFLDRESQLNYTYPELGASRDKGPDHYDNDHRSIVLGKGDRVWETAKQVLRDWQQFPKPWTKIYPIDAPLSERQNVVVLFRLWGIWWINSARIVYVLDDPNHFGFAYGTLPGHIEKGEECFWIERNADGEISYHIRAFSTPRFWMARLAYPLARMYQRRFVHQSMNRMKTLVDSKKEPALTDLKV